MGMKKHYGLGNVSLVLYLNCAVALIASYMLCCRGELLRYATNSPVINSRGSLDNDLNRFLRSRDSSNNNLQNVCTFSIIRNYAYQKSTKP